MNRCGSFLEGARLLAREVGLKLGNHLLFRCAGGVCSSPSDLHEPGLAGIARDSRRVAASPTWLTLLTRMLNRKSLARPDPWDTSLQVTDGIGCEAQPSPHLGDLEKGRCRLSLSSPQGVPRRDTRD